MIFLMGGPLDGCWMEKIEDCEPGDQVEITAEPVWSGDSLTWQPSISKDCLYVAIYGACEEGHLHWIRLRKRKKQRGR